MTTINKGNATLFHQSGKPYTSISNAVVDSVSDPVALAIWTYLQTKDNQWTVVAGWIQDRFGLSRERYRKAMQHLQSLGLIHHKAMRGEDGKMIGTKIIVNYEPVIRTEGTENRTVGEPSSRETEHTGKRQQPIKDSVPIKDKKEMADKSADAIQAFEHFWSAGMRKTNRVSAEKCFMRELKKSKMPPDVFGKMLADDVAERIRLEQFGFVQLHPTTYLNGQRWNDEKVNDAQAKVPAPKADNAWQFSDQGIIRKAAELGITPRPSESYRDLADRLRTHITNTAPVNSNDAQPALLIDESDIPY